MRRLVFKANDNRRDGWLLLEMQTSDDATMRITIGGATYADRRLVCIHPMPAAQYTAIAYSFDRAWWTFPGEHRGRTALAENMLQTSGGLIA